MLSRSVTDRIKGLETPFYLYDMELLRRTLASVVESSSRYGYKVHYAMKANNEERIMREVLACGLGTDCVSGNEVRRSIELGCPASQIVFAGVGKTDKEIRYALEQGIFAFNCESRAELEVINALAGEMGRRARVALRLNPDIAPDTHQHISTGQADSKFGISYKEVEEVAAMRKSLSNVDIVGLHFHIGSQIRTLEAFEKLAARAGELFTWFTDKGFRLDHVNLGGGLGIDYQTPENEPIPDFDSYFSIFNRLLSLPDGTGVHFELGRSIVGQCGELITRVLYTKINAAGKNVALVDASMTELLRPALYAAKHLMENLTGGGRPEEIYTIGGTVCESSDIFARDICLPQLLRGDLLSIKSAGAYGTAMASCYNMHDLPKAVYSDELK